MSSIPATRDKIRQLLGQINVQRVRPRTPFWNIPAHRIPTIRLYRNLLKEAPSDAIRFRIRMLWRKNMSLTGVEQTRKALEQGYKYLTYFRLSSSSPKHLQILNRYTCLINTRSERSYWSYLAQKQLIWQSKLRYRPIITGACFPGSIYHKPLPRMINQPMKVSMMIKWRYEAYEKRIGRHQSLLEVIRDLKVEGGESGRKVSGGEDKGKERGVVKEEDKLLDGKWQEWVKPYQNQMNLIHQAFNRGIERSQTPYPESLLNQLKNARKERILNKTKEHERIRRGEVTPWLKKQLRKGPPAHVLSTMNSNQRMLDKIARHPSEVGFVALAKMKLGRKLKNPNAYLVEDSLEKKAELDRITKVIRRENSRRRTITTHAN